MWTAAPAVLLTVFASSPLPRPAEAATHLARLRADRLGRAMVAQLIDRSATARELVATLQTRDELILYLRHDAGLFERERVRGIGRFWRSGGRIVGQLAVDATGRGIHDVLAIVAHELAHAYELVAAQSGRPALVDRLLTPGPGDPGCDLNSPEVLETQFVIALTRQVRRELAGSGEGARLRDLTRLHGLPEPPAAAP